MFTNLQTWRCQCFIQIKKLKLSVYLLSGQVELDNAFALNPEAPPDEEAEPCPESPPTPTPTCAKVNKTTKVSVTETTAKELLIISETHLS